MKRFLLPLLALSALPALAAYETNYPEGTTVADKGRYVVSIGLGEQTVAVDQNMDHLLYYDLSATALTATGGEEVQPVLNWNGTWMHGYLYLDLNRDGAFDPATELISYSYLDGKNSHRATAAQDCGVGLPTFVVPGLEGDYRMRYVVDWNWADPGGRATEANPITANGGAIVDVTLRVAPTPAAEEKYAISLPAESTSNHAGRHVRAITLSAPLLGTQTVAVNQQDDHLLYHDCTEQEVLALHGQELTLGFEGSINWMNTYVYLDRAGNGDFTSQLSSAGTPLPGTDLLGFSNLNEQNSAGGAVKGGNSQAIPAFRLPGELAPGKWRVRVKVDWDNADAAGGADIASLGGSITDFTLVIPEELPQAATVRVEAMNGMLLAADGSPLPEQIATGLSSLTVKALPVLPGYEADHITAICGETETDLPLGEDGLATVHAELIGGDITLKVNFIEQEESEWTALWADEFDSDKLDKKHWSYDTRSGATWKRYVASTSKGQAAVNKFEEGCYSSWCIATPEDINGEDSEMISGAIMTRNKVDILYGKVEARIKTTPHTGNFPAFWMMPTSAPYGWPKDGEIDIWEQIDDQNTAHHTVHSGWTGWRNYCGWETGPKQGSPQSTSNEQVDATAWHVYSIEWNEEEIKWFTDGVERFSYKNQHYKESEGTFADADKSSNYTEDITWPFSHPFYIILNQSVGNGTWAKNRDLDFKYHTLFDYVRVYQKKKVVEPEEPDPVEPDPGEDGIASVTSDKPAALYDLQGRRSDGSRPGIYIQNGKKIIK